MFYRRRWRNDERSLLSCPAGVEHPVLQVVSRVETMLEEERVGEDQVKGLFLQKLITLVTEGEEVAVKRRVWWEEGIEDRMVASWPSNPPVENRV